MERVMPNVMDVADSSRIGDTSFVLFFLGMEISMGLASFSFDTGLLLLAMAVVAVLPYFLHSDDELPFGRWIFGRATIAVLGLFVGLMFSQAIGNLFPEVFRFVPFTLLILTAMVSCYLQFKNLFEFRVAD